MKILPKGTVCATCGGYLHLQRCSVCKVWHCFPCMHNSDTCRQRVLAEKNAGVIQLPRRWYT